MCWVHLQLRSASELADVCRYQHEITWLSFRRRRNWTWIANRARLSYRTRPSNWELHDCSRKLSWFLNAENEERSSTTTANWGLNKCQWSYQDALPRSQAQLASQFRCDISISLHAPPSDIRSGDCFHDSLPLDGPSACPVSVRWNARLRPRRKTLERLSASKARNYEWSLRIPDPTSCIELLLPEQHWHCWKWSLWMDPCWSPYSVRLSELGCDYCPSLPTYQAAHHPPQERKTEKHNESGSLDKERGAAKPHRNFRHGYARPKS